MDVADASGSLTMEERGSEASLMRHFFIGHDRSSVGKAVGAQTRSVFHIPGIPGEFNGVWPLMRIWMLELKLAGVS